MFWCNVISHNPSYYFKMYISEITNFLVNCIIMNFFIKSLTEGHGLLILYFGTLPRWSFKEY